MIARLFLSAMVSLTAAAAAGGEPVGKPAKVPSVSSPPRSDQPAATPRDKVLTLTLAEGVTMLWGRREGGGQVRLVYGEQREDHASRGAKGAERLGPV